MHHRGDEDHERNRGRECLLLLLALIAVPTAALADSVSKHFADDDVVCVPAANVPGPPAVAAGNQNIKLKWKSKTSGGNSPIMADQDLTGCQSGASDAAEAARKLCEDCTAQAGTVSNFFCSVPPCTCASSVVGSAFGFNCTTAQAGTVTVFKPADVSFTVSDNPDSLLMFVTHKTDAGNTIGTDLLPDINVRIDRFLVPMGTPSSVRVTIISSTPPTTDSFTIDSTNLTDTQILQAASTQLTSRGFTNRILSHKELLDNIQDPSSFTGPAINFSPKPTTLRVEVKATRGMLNIVSNGQRGPFPDVPSLAAWGAALLIGIILLTGSWMLRRRARVQVA